MNAEPLYIWQSDEWAMWRYDMSALAEQMANVRLAQGMLYGRLAESGVMARNQACLAALTEDVVKSSQIEGSHLDSDSVRSSIARRLGVDIGGLAPADRHVDGVVDMVLDATMNYAAPVTMERLLGWQAALFPTGYSGMAKIRVGSLRDDASGPMQVVSGSVGRYRVHFEAMPADRLDSEMARFLDWVNANDDTPPLVKAGIGHLWMVTIHPFEDGNGRVARALGDLLLARADNNSNRFYSLSSQIQSNRKKYYDTLEQTQKGEMDVTPWLGWFFDNLHQAVKRADNTLDDVLARSRFWLKWGDTPMNPRQTKVINRVLDDFQGNLTAKKWAALAKCSPDTALRDINDLVERGALHKSPAGGRSTSYELDRTERDSVVMRDKPEANAITERSTRPRAE